MASNQILLHGSVASTEGQRTQSDARSPLQLSSFIRQQFTRLSNDCCVCCSPVFFSSGYYIHTCPKMKYKRKFQPSELLCPLRYTWHPLDRCLPALDSLDASLRALPPPKDLAKVASSSSGSSSSSPHFVGRCVILSDVAPESVEEDGSAPVYASPSMVQHVGTGAAGAAKKKRKKNKKKKSKPAAEGAVEEKATADDEQEEGEGEEDESTAEEPRSRSKEARVEQGAMQAAAAASSSSSSSSSAASSSPAASSSSSSSAISTVSPSQPYVFSLASYESATRHVLAVAQSCRAAIPIFVFDQLTKFGDLSDFVQRQIQQLIDEYAAITGKEIAQRIVVKF